MGNRQEKNLEDRIFYLRPKGKFSAKAKGIVEALFKENVFRFGLRITGVETDVTESARLVWWESPKENRIDIIPYDRESGEECDIRHVVVPEEASGVSASFGERGRNSGSIFFLYRGYQVHISSCRLSKITLKEKYHDPFT